MDCERVQEAVDDDVIHEELIYHKQESRTDDITTIINLFETRF